MKYRRKHLNERLKAAQDREDEEAEQKILAIIQREKEIDPSGDVSTTRWVSTNEAEELE